MHQPVLMKEVLRLLKVSDHKVYFDGTIGLGGHAEAILNAAPHTQVVGMDRDEQALKVSGERLKKEIGRRLFLFHGDFRDFGQIKKRFKQRFDGALLDLGVSSLQLDLAARGFSFQKEGPLDMRMDPSQKETAADIVNVWPEEKLANIFLEYGEEKRGRRIARAIVESRKEKPFRTTLELSRLILSFSPAWGRRRIHPATRVFQALRIAVNKELEGLGVAIEAIVKSLNVGGRLAVISFHSLEDRIVKQVFWRLEHPCVCPQDIPACVCGQKPVGHRVTTKPVTSSETERLANPRSRSAKLRVIERIAA